MNEWPKGVLKSSDKKVVEGQAAKAGRKGKAAEPLYDRELWGVAFFGVGEPLPGPGLYSRSGPGAIVVEGPGGHARRSEAPPRQAGPGKGDPPGVEERGRENAEAGNPSERPSGPAVWKEFEVVSEGLMPSEQRCAW